MHRHPAKPPNLGLETTVWHRAAASGTDPPTCQASCPLHGPPRGNLHGTCTRPAFPGSPLSGEPSTRPPLSLGCIRGHLLLPPFVGQGGDRGEPWPCGWDDLRGPPVSLVLSALAPSSALANTCLADHLSSPLSPVRAGHPGSTTNTTGMPRRWPRPRGQTVGGPHRHQGAVTVTSGTCLVCWPLLHECQAEWEQHPERRLRGPRCSPWRAWVSSTRDSGSAGVLAGSSDTTSPSPEVCLSRCPSLWVTLLLPGTCS